MKKLFIFLVTLLSIFSLTTPFLFQNDKIISAQGKTRYNLCVFLRFHDENDYINELVINNQTRKDIIDNTYNQDDYSLRDYYKSLSSDKIDLKTVYLFPKQDGFDSFYLDGNREIYAKYSSTNPNGYQNEVTAGEAFKNDWAGKIQEAINKGILPCSITSRDDTISYEDLDSDKDGYIDSITLILSPQLQNNFTTARQEPLYPCMDTSSKISIKTDTNKKGMIESNNYNQWTPNYGSIIRTKNSSSYFLPFAQGAHEMGHMFGYRDLYDYYQKTFPVGNMSVMSNLIAPVPQFMTCYEREINGWINNENIETISSSGTYTLTPVMDNNQTGIVTYKIPILECPEKWVYLEYRSFLNQEINKYDAKDKGLYYSSGNKVEVTSGKPGVLVYIIDKDSKYPTNSHGNPKYFGLEVLGGNPKINNRSDAPRQEGDVIDVYCYDSSGAIKNPGMTITIGSITDTTANFTVNYETIDKAQKITREDVNNDNVYNKLIEIKNTTFYNNTFDDIETLDLAELDITDLNFINIFDFKNLKYLILFGNKISNLYGLYTFVNSHPDTIIILDNNLIDLTTLDKDLLTIRTVFYGLQCTNNNQSILNYYINSSFTYDYQICYQFNNYSMKSLKNEGAGTIEMLPNVPLTITSNYFFTNKNFKSYKYTICYTTSSNDPISLSLNGDSLITLELGTSFTDPSVTTNYIDNLTTIITLNNQVVNSINSLGTYTITYTVTTDNETKSVDRTVIVQDTTPPVISLNGDEYLSISENEYNELGATTSDLSNVTLTITYYLNEKIVQSITTEGNYTVKYTAVDSSSNESIIYRYVTVIKEIEPITLTLNGDSLITLELGDTFTDPSVSTNYIDNLSTIITLNNQVVNSINSLGTYTITYTITTDNETKSVDRTIVVQDTTPPVISLKGYNNYFALAYNEEGVYYQDLSDCTLTIKYYKNNQEIENITESGSYIVEYIITDACNNSTKEYRTVKIISAETAVEEYSEEYGFTYKETYFSTDGKELQEKPTKGSYEIIYTIFDVCGNHSTYTKSISPSSEEINAIHKKNIIAGTVVTSTILSSFSGIGVYIFIKMKKFKMKL